MSTSNFKVKVARHRFEKQKILATYINSELELLTKMCKGRSYNCITWLEKSFSYDMLLNIATNSRLPYSTNAAAMGLVQALYVDRFPQFTHGGGASLPHKLWLFHDATQSEDNDNRKSVTPVLKDKLMLAHEDAFPAFFLPRLSSAYGDPNPVLSHTDHFKFFLLRKLYNDTVNSFGEGGRLIHSDGDFNKLGMAAIHGQQALLLFGFQSTYSKLKELCKPNARLLDGRSDLRSRSGVFNPPESRYKAGGADTEIVLQIKKELIKTFNEVGDLCTNFRLGQFLHLFKEKAMEWTHAECGPEGCDIQTGYFFQPSIGTPVKNNWVSNRPPPKDGEHFDPEDTLDAQYILQATDDAEVAMYQDFEAMFPGGSGEASKLDLKELCNKPDFDVALVDAIMYEDDELMAASLKLLDNIYGQRRLLRGALKDVVLLDRPELPVFGNVHVLRAQMTEMMFLTRTSSSWGVSSSVAGPFGDIEFANIMSTLDRLHSFIYDDGGADLSSPQKSGDFIRSNSIHHSSNQNKVWTLDVALKWSEYAQLHINGSSKRGVVGIHQDLLRACNLQGVLLEAILIDPYIAIKDSTGTLEDIEESFRRLSMVMRAVLSMGRAFAYDNPQNQEILFSRINQLEKLSTPLSLAIKQIHVDENDDEHHYEIIKAGMDIQAKVEGNGKWPSKLSDFAQVLILSILHNNTSVCDKVNRSLPHLFCSIADMRNDITMAETLDIVFIVCKPERAPSSEMQLMACRYFLSSECKKPLLETLALCMKTASEHQSLASPSRSVMKNPARFLRLMTALMEGGNERTANLLDQQAGLTIDLTCDTLVTHIYASLKTVDRHSFSSNMNNNNDNNNFLPGRVHSNEETKLAPIGEGTSTTVSTTSRTSTTASLDMISNIGECVLELITEEGSVGSALFALLVEQVFLLPLNSDQLNSQKLWSFLEKVAVPVMESLGRAKHLSIPINYACGELIAMLELIFMTLVRLSMFETAIEDPIKEKMINDLSEDVDSLLSHRQRPPEFLEESFRTAADEYGVEALNVSQFIEVIEKIMLKNMHSGETSIPDDVKDKIRHSFEEVDIDGDGVVGLYEFVSIFKQLSKDEESHLKVENCSGDSDDEDSSLYGHRLSLSTVECAERIVQIQRGNGTTLGLKKFSRYDRYGSRLHQKKSNIPQSMFESSHVTHEKRKSALVSASVTALHRMNANGIGGGGSGGKSMKGQICLPINNKFELFQKSVENNPLISQALQRRRFLMLDVLERGTPGPPEGIGRDLTNFGKKKPNGAVDGARRAVKQMWKQQRRSTGATSSFSFSSTSNNSKIFPSNGSPTAASSSLKKKVKAYERMDSLTRNTLENQKVVNHRVTPPPVKRTPTRPSARPSVLSSVLTSSSSSSSTQPFSGPGKMQSKRSSFMQILATKIDPILTEEDKASVQIQAAFRRMKAKAEMARKRIVARPGGGKNSNRLSGAVELKWKDIAGRFVRYLGDHFWETGEIAKVNFLIIETWLAHLVKRRTHFIDEFGCKLSFDQLHKARILNFKKPQQLTDEELMSYHERQSALNSLGVTTLSAKILASLSDDVTVGGLPDRVLQLLVELLDGGNHDVQQSLFEHFVNEDNEGKFLAHIEKRIDYAYGVYSEGKKADTSNGSHATLSKEVTEACEHLIQSFRFLQLLCEGHHLGFQEYMRTQPMHTASHANLVKSVANIIVLLCDSSYLISRFGQMEISLISQLLQFLIESVQGPCSGNQHLIGKSDILASLNSIICAKIWKDEELVQKDPLYIDIKTFSCVLLASLLEGGEDESIHEQLSRKIEIVSLQDYQESLEEHIYEILGKVKLESRPRTPYEINFIETKQTALVAVWTILIELHITPVSKLRVKGRKQLIGLVEVAWRNNIHRACFAIPFESQFFTDTAKRAFMETADLSTSDKRMYELIEQTDLFISEMDIIHEQAEKSWIYRLLYNNLRYFKLANYGLVFALNLNILLSPATLGAPSAVIAREIRGDGHMDAFEKSSVIVTTALGALVTVGYGVIISILAVTEVPLLIQELDELALNKVNLTTLDIMMFWTSPLFGLFASFLFIFLHYLNSAPAPELYVAIILMLNVPLALRAYRQTIGTSPSTKALRKFAILYDLLVKKSFLRNHVILAVFCFLGYFVNVEFFTLELLDVVAISPVIADIIQSVTSPGVALGLVFYLFVITVIIYAAFGMNHFASSLIVPVELEDGTPDRVQCGSMLQCFYVIFHLGLSEAGNMNAFLTTNYAGDEEYPMRIIYDSVFFVWVGIVLVNIITGLMVDTFSSIREEKQARADILSSACFVCGTLRRSYDDMSLAPEAPSFDLHISLEHDPWTYVFYIAYLKKKSPQDDSGIESYVRSEVEQNALNWIPSRTSFFIEASKTGAVKSSYVK